VAGLDDDDEKGMPTAHTLGGPQEMAIVYECGPFSLILTSRIPKVMLFGAPGAGGVTPSPSRPTEQRQEPTAPRTAHGRERRWPCGRPCRAGHNAGSGGSLSVAPDEFIRGQRHRAIAFGAVTAIFLVAEGDAGFVERDQPAAGDGDAVRVARQLSEHRLWPVTDDLDPNSLRHKMSHCYIDPEFS